MCGIAGFLNRRTADGDVGRVLTAMLDALGRRGPDSAGLALYGAGEPEGEVCWVKLPDRVDPDFAAAALLERMASVAHVASHRRVGQLVRAVVERTGSAHEFCEPLERGPVSCEVVSLGRRLELVKQVGSPESLEESFGFAGFRGSHGIGHTRLSTESRVDLSHSQPFWARGVPDLATVHNGHVTNYHRLRRIYEQRGVRFFTENDSEVIGVYLADQLSRGRTLEEAVASSLDDLDGSFTYLVATATEFGYARDPFALKPLIVLETPDYVAVANEEVAIRSGLGPPGVAHEPTGHVYRIWGPLAAPSEAVA